MKAVLCIALMGILLLGVGGCNRVGRLDAREQQHEMVAAAYDKIEVGEYREAGRLLREVLDVNPTMARPHLDLAMIYHEHHRDFVKAIYHYQRYVALRPNTEKEDMIRRRVERARASLVAAYVKDLPAETVAAHIRDFRDAGVVEEISNAEEEVAAVQADLEDELAAVQLALAESRQAAQRLDQEREELRAALAESQQALQRLEQESERLRLEIAERDELAAEQDAEIDRLQNGLRRLENLEISRREAVPREPGDDTTDAVSPPDAPVRTYEVRANDSLSGIALRVYGDATKWRIIQEANREVLGDSETLRIGQVLVIPDL